LFHDYNNIQESMDCEKCKLHSWVPSERITPNGDWTFELYCREKFVGTYALRTKKSPAPPWCEKLKEERKNKLNKIFKS